MSSELEDAISCFKEFYDKIAECVEFCKERNVEVFKEHVIKGRKYHIVCSDKYFYLTNGNPYDLNTRIVEYRDGMVVYSKIGIEPTLKTITDENRSLTTDAQWLLRNMPTIIKLLKKDLDEAFDVHMKKEIDFIKTHPFSDR